MKNQLRELRAAKEWSQGDLADALGVSRQTINAIETEKYDPSLSAGIRHRQTFQTADYLSRSSRRRAAQIARGTRWPVSAAPHMSPGVQAMRHWLAIVAIMMGSWLVAGRLARSSSGNVKKQHAGKRLTLQKNGDGIEVVDL